MKLTVRSTNEFVDVTAGKARAWKGFTETGEQCLLFVRCVHIPDHARMQEFEDLTPLVAQDCGISNVELDRIGATVFQGDPRPLGANEYFAGPTGEAKVVAELRAIRDDPTLDAALRSEATELLRAGEETGPTAAMRTREFWRRVEELRRKRDARPSR